MICMANSWFFWCEAILDFMSTIWGMEWLLTNARLLSKRS